jgi:feruloyl esterase
MEWWVEQRKTPEQIIATHKTAGKIDRTRPLCPYPQVAHYKGIGSIDEVSNFSCRVVSIGHISAPTFLEIIADVA